MTTPSDPTRFVLMHTSHAGNVGAAARAMKVMGFADLVLVQPRFADVLSREETVAMASGAADILVRARVVASLDEALDGIHQACATAMTPRDFGPPALAPRAFLQTLRERALRVAFVFGSERFGMSNAGVYRCHACLSIPTDARYGSLNLAQAVVLCAYEWSKAMGLALPEGEEQLPPAPQEELEGLIGHFEALLEPKNYFWPTSRAEANRRTLRNVLTRPGWNHLEIRTLRGVLSFLEKEPRKRD